MFVIGITGSFGSGKTSVASLFKAKGALVVDTDKLAHKLIQPDASCFKSIVKLFGEDILVCGRIDRKKLADVVFKDSKALRKLNEIVHPLVVAQTKKKITQYRRAKKVKAIILDVPLLIESKMHLLCNYIVVVKATQPLQIKRLKQRSGLPKNEVARRIKAQMPINQKLKYADFVIDNRKSLFQTQKQVEEIWHELLKRKK
ncbi:MAG: dephospho-CoA kinase [Candidatus Aceula meridiana]|nr:dephospho-CoA kinase [Candidatus Aceula meridiana]